MRHDHPILRRNHVEPLGHILPDDMQRTSAAGTDRMLGSDSNVDAGKMRRQRAAVGMPLLLLLMICR